MRIIHGADFHLDSPFDALEPAQAAARRAEQRTLPERLADLCADRGADLVLLAGDLLDGRAPYQETVEALVRALGRIRAPVFIAPGNHDYYTPHSPYAAPIWPDNVHIFSSGDLQSIPLPGGVVVHGAAFTASGKERGPLSGFSAPDDGNLHLMVLHGDVDGRAGSKYCPIPTADIAASRLDYLALGHVHTCSGLQWAGDVPWAYAGCPEGRGFDECGAKGVLCADVEPGGQIRLEFLPMGARQYEVIRLPVTAGDDERCVAARAAGYANGRDCIRFLLTGESPDGGLDLQKLRTLCAPRFYSVCFRDATQVRRDLWARAEETTLTGLFLRSMGERLEGAQTQREARLARRATQFGLAALENREDCAP